MSFRIGEIVRSNELLASDGKGKGGKSFYQVIKSERIKLDSVVVKNLGNLQKDWNQSNVRFEGLIKKVPKQYRALLEAQRSAEKIQLRTHLLASSAETLAQSIKRLQQNG